jgi:hypothetical protein
MLASGLVVGRPISTRLAQRTRLRPEPQPRHGKDDP